MQKLRKQLAQDIAKDCKSLEDIHSMLKDLFKQTIEQVLEAEMTEHLGYDKHSSDGINSGNSRNSYSPKTVQTQLGKTTVDIPRDRKGRFVPRIIKKYETNAAEIEEQIISMYAKGMSTRDIEAHLKDIYEIDCSAELVSRITDKIMPMVIEWQSRLLDRLYLLSILMPYTSRFVKIIRSLAKPSIQF
jgi:putative transposase